LYAPFLDVRIRGEPQCADEQETDFDLIEIFIESARSDLAAAAGSRKIC
jgi:hypothetical protein